MQQGAWRREAASAPQTGEDAKGDEHNQEAAPASGDAEIQGGSGAEDGCVKHCERCRETFCGASHHLVTCTGGCRRRVCAGAWDACCPVFGRLAGGDTVLLVAEEAAPMCPDCRERNNHQEGEGRTSGPLANASEGANEDVVHPNSARPTDLM
ncbi:hypothetical protein HK405_013937 [Cladochytrium tenue]|nr:hypothetical protein HK405_013937 [Cladochytrium tenue]